MLTLARSTIAPASPADAMTALPLPRVREAGPDGMLEKVAALLKGPKIEVCGMSDLEAAVFVVANGEQDLTAVNAALATPTSKLVQSGNLREKVLAIYAQTHLAEIAAIDDAIPQRCKPGDFDCRIQASESRPQVRAAVAEPLVKLALAGRDPDTYAAAAYACRGSAPVHVPLSAIPSGLSSNLIMQPRGYW